MRSPTNSFLMIMTILSPGLAGASINFYQWTRIERSLGYGGIPMPELLPQWLTSFNFELYSRLSGWPVLSELQRQVDSKLESSIYAGLLWSVVFVIPVVALGFYLSWWNDRGIARRGRSGNVLSWMGALPGIIVTILALIIVVIVLATIALFIYLVTKSAGGDSRLPETAIDSSGRVFRTDSSSGNYQPEHGVFRQSEDKDMFGRPNVERDWSGRPREVAGGLFGSSPETPLGGKLYERRDS